MEIIKLPSAAFDFNTAINLINDLIVEDKKIKWVIDPETEQPKKIIHPKYDNKETRFDKCIEYLKSYFYQIAGTPDFYMFDYDNDEFIYLEKAYAKESYFIKFDKYVQKEMTDKNISQYRIINNNFKPRLYKESNINYVNVSPYHRLEKLKKPYNEFDDETKKNVDLLLNYIFEVLANSDKEVFDYICKWYAAMFQGKKNDSALYFKSDEGTGKSTLGDFISTYILKKPLSVKCGSSPLLGNFNSILKDAIYVMFEELPTYSKNEWMAVSSKLKDLVTSNKIIINEKYKKETEIANPNNYIINTNNEAIQHAEGRRYFVADVCSKYRNNTQYFGNLHKKCFNDQVAKAFFNYMLEIDTKTFYAQNMPMTQAKAEAIQNNLKNEYKFIRDEYLLKKKPIYTKRNELYDEYNIYRDIAILSEKDRNNFYKSIRAINIKEVKNTGFYYFSCSLDELDEISKREKWMIGHEKIEEDNEIAEEENNIIVDVEKEELKKENEELKKQIEELKKQLELLKNPPKVEEPKKEEVIIQEEKKPKKEKKEKKDKKSSPSSYFEKWRQEKKKDVKPTYIDKVGNETSKYIPDDEDDDIDEFN